MALPMRRKFIFVFSLCALITYTWYVYFHEIAILELRKHVTQYKSVSKNSSSEQRLFSEEYNGTDRFLIQSSFVPRNQKLMTQDGKVFKNIVLFDSHDLYLNATLREFEEKKCAVNTCTVTTNHSKLETADLVVFGSNSQVPRGPRRTSQIWVFHTLESPVIVRNITNFTNLINWTMTYRTDCDLPRILGKFLPHNETMLAKRVRKNFAVNKTRKVAWFVSNCFSGNKRITSALQLKQFIEVDIVGKCLRNDSCPRSDHKRCLEMLKDYKFYLAFENANCKDYITEKFFINALSSDVIPIVLGARKEDYLQLAPPHSFIYAQDFKLPKELGDYLLMLDSNDDLYNEYFDWKGRGKLESGFEVLCRLCAMLHSKIPTKSYDDLDGWWRGPGICSTEERVNDIDVFGKLNGTIDRNAWQWPWW